MGNDLDKYLDLCFDKQTGFVQVATKGNGHYQQFFFRWPDNREHIKNIVLSAAHDMEVYISPSLFKIPNGKKENVIGSQVIWVEFDGDSGRNWNEQGLNLPEPNAVIQTSMKNHLHVYWRIPFSSPDVVESINRKLTYALEADSSGWDAGQVLRPPETFNHKRDLPVQVLTAFGFHQYDLDQFRFLKDVPLVTSVLDYNLLKNPDKIMAGYNWSNKLFNQIKIDIPALGMRSHFLMHLGYELAEKGLEPNDIVSLLLVADERVGKFSGRSDQLVRLAEIAARATSEYELASQLVAFNILELTELPIVFESIWGELLPKTGNLLLAGAPSVGKTQFSLHAAIEMALAGPSLHGYKLEPVERLLFVSMEMPSVGMKWLATQQLSNLTDDQKKILADKLIVSVPGMALKPDEVENLVRRVEPKGIFFDSLAKLSLGEMSSEGEAQRFLNWDSRIRNLHECFTWYIHHNRKATASDKEPNQLSDVYGSYLYGAQIDTVLSFYKQKVNDTLKISAVKVRYGKETEWELTRLENLTFVRKDDNSKSNKSINVETSSGTVNLNFG